MSIYFIGNIDQAQYCDKIKGLVDFLGSELSTEELNMIWKMQVTLLIKIMLKSSLACKVVPYGNIVQKDKLV